MPDTATAEPPIKTAGDAKPEIRMPSKIFINKSKIQFTVDTSELPVKTYDRCRPSDLTDVMQRVRAELGEHFDDYLIVVRRRSPQQFSWAMSDPEWASGAMDRVLRKVIG